LLFWRAEAVLEVLIATEHLTTGVARRPVSGRTLTSGIRTSWRNDANHHSVVP